MTLPAGPEETLALLYPLGEDVVVVSRKADHDPFGNLGTAAIDLAAAALKVAGTRPDTTKARVFTTTPDIERLLDQCKRYPAGDSGHFYPVLLDRDGHYLRQISLKEVDPAIVAAAVNPAVLAVAAATQVITARLDQLAEQLEDVSKDVKQILQCCSGSRTPTSRPGCATSPTFMRVERVAPTSGHHHVR